VKEMAKLTIEELSNDIIDTYKTDLTPINNKLNEIFELLSNIDVKIGGNEIKQEIINILIIKGQNVNIDNTWDEIIEVIRNL
jgi:hypothetical protein